MRDNGPYTDTEIEVQANVVSVSKTDLMGRITYVNQEFVDLSGFDKDELLGSPHNLVRHPQMPSALFADLWSTIKSGHPWTGVLKNRTKQGDYYWIYTSIIPQIESGLVTQYISIRHKPTPEQMAEAKILYAQLEQGLSGSFVLSRGQLIDTSLKARIGRFLQSIAGRLNLVFWAVSLLVLLLGVVVIFAIKTASDSDEAIYQDGTVLVLQLNSLNEQIRDDVYQLSMIFAEMGPNKSSDDRIDLIKRNHERVTTQLARLNSWLKTPDERELGEQLTIARASFYQEIDLPAITAAQARDKEALRQILTQQMGTKFDAIRTLQKKLSSLELEKSGALHERDAKLLHALLVILPLALVVLIVLSIVFKGFLLRTIKRPLIRLETFFESIAGGDFFGDLGRESVQEFVICLDMLKAMRAKLAFSGLERQENERQALADRAITLQLNTEARRAAEEANRAKTDFLSSMSHELRTPLNAIIGFAELLLKGKSSVLSDRQRMQVEHIHKGGEYLLHLINEILEFAKIEAGKLSLSIEPFALRPVLDHCLTMTKSMVAKAGVTVIDQIGDTPVMLMADRTRTQQIIINLLSNAAKYNHTGGAITLDFMVLADGMGRLRITDDGMGFDDSLKSQLFQPFNRLGAEHTEIEGSGIGLALVHKLMDMMGGRIDCESKVGVGSTFWVDFPVSNMAALSIDMTRTSVDPVVSQSTSSSEYLLLYIEDNPANISLMKDVIEEYEGWDLKIAKTGEEGLAVGCQHDFDLIICDINLPGISGIDVVKQLRLIEAYQGDFPILALSADVTPKTIKEALTAGFSGYLTKPMSLRDLEKAILMVSDRRA